VVFDFVGTIIFSKTKPKKFFVNYKKTLQQNEFLFNKKNNTNLINKNNNLTKNSRQELDLFKQFFIKSIGINPSKKMCLQLAKEYYSFRIKNDFLMPNALNVFKYLKKKKIIFGIITNTKSDANYKVAKNLKILKYFNFFLMSHKEKTKKSEIKIFYTMLNKINKNKKHKIQPQECLIIGNDLNEDTIAKKIGMKTIILKKYIKLDKKIPYLEPDYYIDDLKEIIHLIESQLSDNNL
jgi:FMN phosphatase YigB (HAD superfamily)